MTRIIPRDLIRHMEWTPGTTSPPPPNLSLGAVVRPAGFHAEVLEDRYVFGPVLHRGELYRVSLSKAHLDGGSRKTQDQWLEYLKDSEWRLGSGPLQIDYLSLLRREADGEYKDIIAEMHDTIKVDYDSRSPLVRAVTGSRVFYSPTGLDKVVHNYGTPDAYPSEARIVGPDGWLRPETGFEDSLDALLGTRDIVALNQLTQWLQGLNAYMYRVNNTPGSEIQRALVLGGSGRFNIGASSNIGSSGPARGVATQKIIPSETGVAR